MIKGDTPLRSEQRYSAAAPPQYSIITLRAAHLPDEASAAFISSLL